METREWMEELTDAAREDPAYQACLAEAKRLEPAFLALRDSLSGPQRDILEGYLCACEEMDHALLSLTESLTRHRCQREFASLLRLDILYRDFYRNMVPRVRGTTEWTPEYLQRCREYNETARHVMADTGVEIPLIDLDII